MTNRIAAARNCSTSCFNLKKTLKIGLKLGENRVVTRARIALHFDQHCAAHVTKIRIRRVPMIERQERTSAFPLPPGDYQEETTDQCQCSM
jgi:hypothetical protein